MMADTSKLNAALYPIDWYAHINHDAGIRCVDATIAHILQVLRDWPEPEEVAALLGLRAETVAWSDVPCRIVRATKEADDADRT